MTQSYWQKLQDLVRKKAYDHAMYHYLKDLGEELGRNNQSIPKDKVVNYLRDCKVENIDYLLTGLFRGHHEGLKQWRVELLNADRQARLKNEPEITR